MIPRHGYLSTLVNPLKSHFERFTTQLPGMRVRVWLQVVSEVSENKVVDDAIVTPVKWYEHIRYNVLLGASFYSIAFISHNFM